MEAQIAVAKQRKYSSPESGDTLEMIERPGGGISFVLADGQMSGRSAKAISNVVTRKAISLLGEGVRDGAAARAASDYLYAYRDGKVLATLNILSFDLVSQTMVITRNNPAPVVLVQKEAIRLLDEVVHPVGARRNLRPSIHEVPLEIGTVAVMFTDGLLHAGERKGTQLDIVAAIQGLLELGSPQPQHWADGLLRQALDLDDGRPGDDITVVVAAILPLSSDEARRLTVRMPL